jgi:hypothetical protein
VVLGSWIALISGTSLIMEELGDGCNAKEFKSIVKTNFLSIINIFFPVKRPPVFENDRLNP